MQRNIKIIIAFFVAAFLFLAYLNDQKERKTPSPEESAKTENVERQNGPEVNPPAITYDRASANLIVVELPFPGAVVGKEFSVIGRARGNWFFEASFPVKVLDKDGNILVQHYAMAEGEWMTTEFVPFKGDLVVPESYIGPATLVLMKDNASGLPEHDASASFPINIEY